MQQIHVIASKRKPYSNMSQRLNTNKVNVCNTVYCVTSLYACSLLNDITSYFKSQNSPVLVAALDADLFFILYVTVSKVNS